MGDVGKFVYIFFVFVAALENTFFSHRSVLNETTCLCFVGVHPHLQKPVKDYHLFCKVRVPGCSIVGSWSLMDTAQQMRNEGLDQSGISRWEMMQFEVLPPKKVRVTRNTTNIGEFARVL